MKKRAFGILNTKDFQKDEVFANDRFTVTITQIKWTRAGENYIIGV